jgi:hypothetical protein
MWEKREFDSTGPTKREIMVGGDPTTKDDLSGKLIIWTVDLNNEQKKSNKRSGRIYLSSKIFVIKYNGGSFPKIKSGKKYWYRCVNRNEYGGELITYKTKKDYNNKKALARYVIGTAG